MTNGQAVGVAPVRSDGPELRHVDVEKREQIRECVKRESGWSVGLDGKGGERKQPHPGWLWGFRIGWLSSTELKAC